MYLAKILLTSALIWMTPISGLAQTVVEAGSSDVEAGSSDVRQYTDQGEILGKIRDAAIIGVVAGLGAAAGNILTTRPDRRGTTKLRNEVEKLRKTVSDQTAQVSGLKRLIMNQHRATRNSASRKTAELERKLAAQESQLASVEYDLQYEMWKLQFVQRYGLRQGMGPGVVMDINDNPALKECVLEKFDPLRRYEFDCRYERSSRGRRREADALLKPTRTEPHEFEVLGDAWNRYVTQCGGSWKNYMHPDEGVRFVADPVGPHNSGNARLSSEGENRSRDSGGGFDFSASLQSKVEGLKRIIGGAVRSVGAAAQDMPAGFPNVRGVGVPAPAFGGL
ncbi:MAG: hypothetical protein M1816_006082 [Peltula sp. TS41687]|nr:MAG: hypothetical protein M1816_006082 [Peltula sp. TS41687]